MALRRTHFSPQPDTEGGLSKREQRKLQQTLKHFPTINDPKAKKKRKPNDKEIRIYALGEAGHSTGEGNLRGEEPEILVETKQQSQLNSTPTRQPAVEIAKSPLIEQSARKEEQPCRKEGFLNSEYPLAEECTIADFLVQYQCQQMEKTYLKEGGSFDELDKGGEALRVSRNASSEGLMKRICGLLADYRKALDKRPFSKARLALTEAISKEAK